MSAFFIVSTQGPPEPYSEHWPTFELAVADFIRLLNAGEAEAIELRFSS